MANDHGGLKRANRQPSRRRDQSEQPPRCGDPWTAPPVPDLLRQLAHQTPHLPCCLHAAGGFFASRRSFFSRHADPTREARERPGGLPRRCCSAEPPSTCGGMRRSTSSERGLLLQPPVLPPIFRYPRAWAGPGLYKFQVSGQVKYSRVKYTRVGGCCWQHARQPLGRVGPLNGALFRRRPSR